MTYTYLNILCFLAGVVSSTIVKALWARLRAKIAAKIQSLIPPAPPAQ